VRHCPDIASVNSRFLTVIRAVALAAAFAFAPLAAASADDHWRLGQPLLLSPAPDQAGGLSLSFTPRSGGILSLDGAKLSVAVVPLDGTFADRDWQLDRREFDQRPVGGFAIGGALVVDDVVLRGEFMQRESSRFQEGGVGASVRIDGVTTNFSYSEVEDTLGTGYNRLGVGAEYDAAPGLSLGAGLWLRDGEGGSAAGDATGSLRVRLSF
jgi:hypothetical protein